MKKKRRSAFVPRVIFGTVFVGVVPACALMSCGGDDTTTGTTLANRCGRPHSNGRSGRRVCRLQCRRTSASAVPRAITEMHRVMQKAEVAKVVSFSAWVPVVSPLRREALA